MCKKAGRNALRFSTRLIFGGIPIWLESHLCHGLIYRLPLHGQLAQPFGQMVLKLAAACFAPAEGEAAAAAFHRNETPAAVIGGNRQCISMEKSRQFRRVR